jgi:hypothetical protein
MPAELSPRTHEGIGRDDRRDATQGLPTQPVGSHGESPTVVVREPQSSPTDLSPEDAISSIK